ncbi:RICIN domain-containing protein [Geminocystis sp.]|uniref:RICIN domain-containing protein n=1 Tax=Geminocystis sp. TaxID=2664100 RepID=UPI003593764B
MKKVSILFGISILGMISLSPVSIAPVIAGCGFGDITCNPKDWTCPPGGYPPSPQVQNEVVATVIIQTPVNGRVLDFRSSSNNREPLILVNKHSSESQQWQLLKRRQSDYYIIQSMVNERVLDFRNAQNNREPLILVDYRGGDSQLWSLEKLSNGRYLIKSKVNGRVLDFRNAENNKEPLLLVDEHRGHSQQWILESVR